MDVEYFNFSSKFAEGWWDRSSFVRHWWRIYAHDPHWVPPYYPAFRRFLEPGHNPHLSRLEPSFLTIEALPRRKRSRGRPGFPNLYPDPFIGSAFEQSVATAILLRDPRRRDRTAYLALLHCVNDSESLERLLDAAVFQLTEEGFNHLVTLSALSPYLGSGILQDQWDQIPPIGTPSDPPYLFELMEDQFNPGSEEHLYHLNVPPDLRALPESVKISKLDPFRLAEELLPLFLTGLPDQPGFPQPDSFEARFLIEWVSIWPVETWLATIDEKEVGFTLLGPDIAQALRRYKGGRRLISRLRLSWISRQPSKQGRIYFGGVLPGYRQKGIGKQLLRKALASAQEHGWEQLVTGPILAGSIAANYLEGAGATRGAGYRYYSKEI